jgi:AcrR family transcriptional regulator
MKKASVRQFAFQDKPLVERIRQRKQPLQGRSRATTEALLEATLQVLVREGYVRLTTTRVAERAGVSVGTLYQYFPDKRSLIMALKQRYFALMLGAMKTALAASAGASPQIMVRAALAALIDVKRENVALSLALREPLAEPESNGVMAELMGQFMDMLTGTLAPSYPARSDIKQRAALLVAMIEGAMGHAVANAPHWLHEQWFLDDLTGVAVGYLNSLERSAEHSPS